jgi:hypothetical protein
MDYRGEDADALIRQNLSKMSFLRVEARSWLFSTKLIELLFASGCLLLATPLLVDELVLEQLPYVGGIMMVISYLQLAKRRAIWSGWYFGYEEGFKEAATANLGYWGESDDEDSDLAKIDAVINRIKDCEEAISDEDIAARDKEIREGFKLFQGFLVGWRIGRPGTR